MEDNKELTVVSPQMDIKEFNEQKSSIASLVKSQMKKDKDYGVIPGTTKKTLYQTGAEKLAKYFGLVPQYTLIKEIEDWDSKFVYYKYRCELVHFASGRVVGNIERSCNSRESKYKYKTVYDVANTIKAMAQKRALVAAVRTATMASEIFDDEEPTTNGGTTTKDEDPKRIKLLGALFATAKDRGFDSDQLKTIIKKKFNIESTNDITNDQMREVTEKLTVGFRVVKPGEKPQRIESSNSSEIPTSSPLEGVSDEKPSTGDESLAQPNIPESADTDMPKSTSKPKCYTCGKEFDPSDTDRPKELKVYFDTIECQESYYDEDKIRAKKREYGTTLN